MRASAAAPGFNDESDNNDEGSYFVPDFWGMNALMTLWIPTGCCYLLTGNARGMGLRFLLNPRLFLF